MTGFQYARRVEGYVKEYKRVFYQGSTGNPYIFALQIARGKVEASCTAVYATR